MPSQKASATKHFRRQILYLVIAGIISVPGALAYLASYGAVTLTMALAVTFGVFVSIVLGGGLMAIGFYSAGSGVDEAVANAAVDVPAAIVPTTPAEPAQHP